MNELVRFVLQSGLVAKIVLIIILILSVISWGIMIEKVRLFTKVYKENDKFSRLFKLRVKWNDRFTLYGTRCTVFSNPLYLIPLYLNNQI